MPSAARLDWRHWIDVRSGLAGGVVMGGAVWFINMSHSYMGATTAALKQFAYTFIMGALIMRLCTRLALREGPDALMLAIAVIAPSCVTIGATFLLHSMRGTPEPALSTIPVSIASPIGFIVWSRRVRRDGETPWDRLDAKAETAPTD